MSDAPCLQCGQTGLSTKLSKGTAATVTGHELYKCLDGVKVYASTMISEGKDESKIGMTLYLGLNDSSLKNPVLHSSQKNAIVRCERNSKASTLWF